VLISSVPNSLSSYFSQTEHQKWQNATRNLHLAWHFPVQKTVSSTLCSLPTDAKLASASRNTRMMKHDTVVQKLSKYQETPYMFRSQNSDLQQVTARLHSKRFSRYDDLALGICSRTDITCAPRLHFKIKIFYPFLKKLCGAEREYGSRHSDKATGWTIRRYKASRKKDIFLIFERSRPNLGPPSLLFNRHRDSVTGLNWSG
jgi:hypothetical protein